MTRRSNLIVPIILAVGLLPISGLHAGETLDGIAATVDNKIILLSEVRSQVQLIAMQAGIDLSSEAAADSLSRDILQQMIDEKLILIEAQQDTSIKVEEQEVQEALNRHIERIKQQFPSEQAFLGQLSAEGLTLKELRSRYSDEVRNQLYKERFLNQMLSRMTISSGEVREFFSTNQDSLPQRPAAVHLAHILISTEPSQATRDSLFAFAQLLSERAAKGEDFSLLAKNYSADVTAENGGDLGWFARGTMVPAFETAAFALQPGQVSDIVETQYGFHIIKCTERKGDQVRASHILIKFKASEAELDHSKALADSLYALLVAGADFVDLAARYSADDSSARNGGDLGWFAADNLLADFRATVALTDSGQFSEPVLSDYGYHILKVLDKQPGRPLDFQDDYGDIEEIAKRYKAQQELDKWLQEAKKKYFIEVKL